MTKFNTNVPKSLVFKTLIRNYPYAIVFKDKNFKTRFANDLFCRYFSIPAPSVVIGTSSTYFLSEEDRNFINELEARIKQTPQQYEFKLNMKYGKSNKIYITKVTPVLKNGEFEGVIYTINDITREESLNNRLKMKHNLLKTFLDNIPLLTYLKDKERNFVTGSKFAREFINTGRDIVSNLSLDMESMFATSPDEDIEVLDNDSVLFLEREIHDVNGAKHWYTVHKLPMKNEVGETEGVITIAKNIDAEKLLDAQRETFVASVGHDLKNPTLAQIRALDLLLNGAFGDVPEEQREILEMVADSCKYMNAMLASLLATYRNEKGIVRLSNEQISLIALVQECVEEMTYFAKDKEVLISLSKEFENDLISADKVQMKRVVMNLLSNGIKYAYKGTVVKVKVFEENEYVCFEFENNSPYISLEKQETIFAQYVSFAEAHKELGIGLGLYASKKIVEAHEGIIYVKSFENDTNIFGFKIPNKIVEKEKERVVVF